MVTITSMKTVTITMTTMKTTTIVIRRPKTITITITITIQIPILRHLCCCCQVVHLSSSHQKIQCPIQYRDMFVDDFLGLVQGYKYHRCCIKRALLHAMDKVFWPLEQDNNPHHQGLVSIKKLLKRDGT